MMLLISKSGVLLLEIILPLDRLALYRCHHFLEEVSVDDKIMSDFFSCSFHVQHWLSLFLF